MKKAIPRRHLQAACDAMRGEGKRIVFTNGCFDLLHPGHIRLLTAAAAHGDVVLVAINDDASVRRLKGEKRPIYPAAERAEILLALRSVDYVTVFREDTPLETIQMVKPEVLVKGDEYRSVDIVGASLVRRGGGEVVRVPMKSGHSTRLMVRRISRAKS